MLITNFKLVELWMKSEKSNFKVGFILVLCFLAAPVLLFAQDAPVPIRSGMSPSDSLSIEQLLHKASSLQHAYPDSMITLARTAFNKSIQNGFNEGAGRALGLMATGQRNLGHYHESIILYKQALSFINKQRYNKEFYLAATYNALFGAYFPLGLYDSAAISCYKVIDIYNQAGDRRINPESSSVSPLIDAYQYLSICWLQLGYYQQALTYIRKAEQLSEKDKNKYQLLSILLNKGSIYLNKQEPDSAHLVFIKGRQIAIKENNNAYISGFNLKIAAVLLQKGWFEKAIPTLETALAEKDTGRVTGESKVAAAYNLAQAYYHQEQYDLALKVLLPAMDKAAALNLKYNSISPHLTLSEIYKAKGNIAKAYEHLQMARKIADSQISKDKVQTINLLDIALQTSEKDKEIIQNKLQIASQKNKIKEKNTWLGMVSLSVLLLIILFVSLYRSNKHKRRLQEEKIVSLSKEQEIIRLKAVMKGEEKERTRFARELHDGFISQLSAVKMNFSALSDSIKQRDKFDENIVQFEETIQELRKTAQNLMPEILLRGGLVEAVQIFSERMSLAHHLLIDFHFYGYLPRLNVDLELSLYRMIQESIYNVIKHAHATRCIVQINCEDNVVGITIEDNGMGMDLQKQYQGTGLHNLKVRVAGLNGYINITSEQQVGTTIYIEFDITHEINS